jgi:hypothetical protein
MAIVDVWEDEEELASETAWHDAGVHMTGTLNGHGVGSEPDPSPGMESGASVLLQEGPHADALVRLKKFISNEPNMLSFMRAVHVAMGDDGLMAFAAITNFTFLAGMVTALNPAELPFNDDGNLKEA